MKYAKPVFIMAFVLVIHVAAVAGPFESFWVEDFEAYDANDLSWQAYGTSVVVHDSVEWPFFALNKGLNIHQPGGTVSLPYTGGVVKDFAYSPSTRPDMIVLWSEDFQSFSGVAVGGDLPTGGDIVPQDSNWSLTELNLEQGAEKAYSYAKIEDNTRTADPGVPDLVIGLPDGEQVLEVRGIKDTSGLDGWHRATYTLPALSTSESRITVSARLGHVTAADKHAKFRVGNIVEFTLETNNHLYLQTDYGNVIIGYELNDGSWHDYDFEMDFDADTIKVWMDDVSLGTWGMPGDYSLVDLTDITAEAMMWDASLQSMLFIDNLAVSESAPVVWEEYFQGASPATAAGDPSQDPPVGGDLVSQIAGWSLSGENLEQGAESGFSYAKILDNTIGWPSPDFVLNLPVGIKILEVRCIKDTNPGTDGIHRAVYDLTSAGWTKDIVKVSARLAHTPGGSKNAKFGVGSIVEFILEANGSLYLQTDTGNTVIGSGLNDGLWHDYDFVMDFAADTIIVVMDDSYLGTYNMTSDKSASDVTDVTLEAWAWAVSGQSMLYAEGLSVMELDEYTAPPVTVSDLLAATDSRHIGIEFDAWNMAKPAVDNAEELGYYIRDAAGASIVEILAVNSSGTDNDLHLINGVDIGTLWNVGHNHYKLDFDFVDDTVDLYLNYETTPSLSGIFLPDLFEPEDIRTLKFETKINFKANSSVTSYIDNIELYDGRECPVGDVTGDCKVDLLDFSVIADDWLED